MGSPAAANSGVVASHVHVTCGALALSPSLNLRSLCWMAARYLSGVMDSAEAD